MKWKAIRSVFAGQLASSSHPHIRKADQTLTSWIPVLFFLNAMCLSSRHLLSRLEITYVQASTDRTLSKGLPPMAQSQQIAFLWPCFLPTELIAEYLEYLKEYSLYVFTVHIWLHLITLPTFSYKVFRCLLHDLEYLWVQFHLSHWSDNATRPIHYMPGTIPNDRNIACHLNLTFVLSPYRWGNSVPERLIYQTQNRQLLILR